MITALPIVGDTALADAVPAGDHERGEGARTLVVATSDDTGRTKTEVTRRVPVHVMLARVLAAWKLSHWERIYGHAPARMT
jgi:hypothetical protein